MSNRLSSMRRVIKRNRIAAAKTPKPKAPPTTYWNGDPAPARRVRVRVGTVDQPQNWCAALEGTIRDAVEVTHGKQVFFLDDQDGHDAWRKVTWGMGAPELGHYHLPWDSVVVEVLK